MAVTVEAAKRVFGSHLKSSELSWLHNVQAVFTGVITSKTGFAKAIEFLAMQVQKMTLRDNITVSARMNVDLYNFSETELKKHVAKRINNKLTKSEEQFANDVIAVIEFVIRNGIGFHTIIDALEHDFLKIKQQGTLDKALARSFRPKVSGWASYDPNDLIYEPEEAGA